MKIYYIFLLCTALTSCASDMQQLPDDDRPASRLLYQYESSQQCKGCHTEQYFQYETSMHAKAFTNPIFEAQYFNEVVPRAERDSDFAKEARKCVACHAPVLFMNYTGLVSKPAQIKRFETGVTCDFCHTFAGYSANGDYLQNPSGKKQGPFKENANATFHAEYSGFLQMGDFCGRCHNTTNHVGVEITSTFDEWQTSRYGQGRFACQECHMNKDGYLRNGSAQFDRGQAVHVNIGHRTTKQKEHERLNNHSFPGAHSINQLQDSIPLEIKITNLSADSTGHLHFAIAVNNERSGHKMPSGSSDLRLMWLQVKATAADGSKIPVTLDNTNTAKTDDYGTAGTSQDDATILGDDVPVGSRIYRTVLMNSAGRQSLYQYDAIKNIFDNRLKAEEIRYESYYLEIPDGFSGNLKVEAALYYRGAPSSFMKRIKVRDVPPVLISEKQTMITIAARQMSKK